MDPTTPPNASVQARPCRAVRSRAVASDLLKVRPFTLLYIKHGTTVHYSHPLLSPALTLETVVDAFAMVSRLQIGGGISSQRAASELSRLIKALLLQLDSSRTPFWASTYDTVDPFREDLGSLMYRWVWIFDIKLDTLTQILPTGSSWVPMALVRSRQVTLDDFKPAVPRPPLEATSHDFPPPYWNPELGDLYRERAFTGQILQDFAQSWKRLLGRQQSKRTVLCLASAVVRITMLDLEFTRKPEDEGCYRRFALMYLPAWAFYGSKIVKAGRAWFVLCEDPAAGRQKIHRHHASRIKNNPGTPAGDMIYILLGLHYIALFRGKDDDTVEWTKPEQLFTDQGKVSQRAIDLLLWAARPEPPLSRLNLLPPELQDRILYFATSDSLSAAKLGCELGLGLPYHWHEGAAPVESDIWSLKKGKLLSLVFFGKNPSGVSYGLEPTNEGSDKVWAGQRDALPLT